MSYHKNIVHPTIAQENKILKRENNIKNKETLDSAFTACFHNEIIAQDLNKQMYCVTITNLMLCLLNYSLVLPPVVTVLLGSHLKLSCKLPSLTESKMR